MDKDTFSAETAPRAAAQTPPRPQATRGAAAQRRLIAVLLILVAVALTYTPWPHGLDRAAYGLVSQLIPGQADLSAVAFIDLGPAPADYDTLARAVNTLRGRGVDRVGLYLPLHQSQSPPDMDALARDAQRGAPGAPAPRWLARLDRDSRLADAIRGHGGVVLAAFPAPGEGARGASLSRISPGFVPWHSAHPALEMLNRPPVPPLTRDRLQPPLPQLAVAARGVGAALPPGVNEGVTLALDERAGPWAGFLLPLLNHPRAMSTDITLEPGRGLRIGADLLPLGPAMSALPLPPRQDPRDAGLPVHDVRALLGGPLSADDLGGRIVIMGHGDDLSPSVTLPSGLRLPEAIWQAYALGSFLDRSWIHVPGWFHGLERVLLLLAGLYLLSLPLHVVGRTAGLLLSLLIAVVVFNAGLVLLLVQQVWLPVTLPVAVLLAGHGLLWAGLRHTEMLGQDRRDASEAHYQLGSLLRGQGQLEPAFEHFRQVRDVSEPLREQLYQLGHDLVRRRLYPRAMEVYAHLDAISPRYRDVPVRIERLRGLTGQGHGHFGNNRSRVDGTLIVDGDTLEKPTLGRYQVERQLGRGSMGIVYLGVDPKIGRKVAIKTLALNQEFDQEMLEQVKWRFFREAEASGRLNHRNIVTIYDVGEEHDLAFIAMDYLEGTSLDHFTRRDNLLPVGEVLEICAQVAEGLDYAHARQVVHRDVKPANVIFDRRKGQVTITDFGIACLTDNNRTRTGTILGTPAFMSPEQVSGDPVDGRSDLFSLGVSLYQLLCGQLPFKADTMAGLVYQITQTRHQSISDIRPELGPVVALILNRALEKDPERRYQSGAEFAKALRDCAAALKRSPKPGQFAEHRALMP
jgi:eukaryotic-like serine/threonine-protein kinase